MFLFIAILWYLQVLIPNSTQSISDVDALIDAGTKSLNKMLAFEIYGVFCLVMDLVQKEILG